MYISTARPVIYLEYANLQVFGYTPSGDGLNGFVSFGGVVLSGLADTTPDGVISSIRVWIDGHPENTLEFPLNVYKDNTGDLGAPYPYMGNFYVDSLPVQNLMPDGDFGSGWAIFHIETEDCLGSGVAEVEFYVDLTPINSDIFPQQLQAQSPAFILNDDDDDTVPLAVEIEGPQDVISSAGFEVQTLDGTRPVVQWPDENGDPHDYLATADGSRPEVMLAIEDPDGDKACWLDTGDPSCDDSSVGAATTCLGRCRQAGHLPTASNGCEPDAVCAHSPATAVKPLWGFEAIGGGAPSGALIASGILDGGSRPPAAGPPPGLGGRYARALVPRNPAAFAKRTTANGIAPVFPGDRLLVDPAGLLDGGGISQFLTGFAIGFGAGGVDLVVGTPRCWWAFLLESWSGNGSSSPTRARPWRKPRNKRLLGWTSSFRQAMSSTRLGREGTTSSESLVVTPTKSWSVMPASALLCSSAQKSI